MDSELLLAEGPEDDGAADGEADHGSQRGDQHEVGAEVDDVGEHRGDRKDESQYIEPERGADVAHVFAQTKLQQESGESDSRHDHQREWAGESGTAGVDHHQSERE
jgi:hypothetical protein